MAVFSKKPGASPPPLWATLREIVKWLFYWTYYDFESFQNRKNEFNGCQIHLIVI
jgi:hypothetical protein